MEGVILFGGVTLALMVYVVGGALLLRWLRGK